MPMTDAWHKLRFLQNVTGQRVSVGILAVVPIIASINSSVQNAEITAASDAIFAIANILDQVSIRVPVNLLRTFWAALFYLMSSKILVFAFPPHLVAENDWLDSHGAEKIRRRIKRSRPTIEPGELEDKVKGHRLSSNANVCSFRTLLLVISAVLLAASIYLALIVLMSNAANVIESCRWTIIVDWGATTC